MGELFCSVRLHTAQALSTLTFFEIGVSGNHQNAIFRFLPNVFTQTLLVKVVFWDRILTRFQKFSNVVVFETKNRRNELKVETESFILVPMRAPSSQ